MKRNLDMGGFKRCGRVYFLMSLPFPFMDVNLAFSKLPMLGINSTQYIAIGIRSYSLPRVHLYNPTKPPTSKGDYHSYIGFAKATVQHDAS